MFINKNQVDERNRKQKKVHRWSLWKNSIQKIEDFF